MTSQTMSMDDAVRRIAMDVHTMGKTMDGGIQDGRRREE